MTHPARAFAFAAAVAVFPVGCTDDAVTVPDSVAWDDVAFTAGSPVPHQWCLVPGICTTVDEVGYQFGDLATTGVPNAPLAGERTGFAIHNDTATEQLAMIQYKECNAGQWVVDGVLLGADEMWAAHVDEVVGASGRCGGGTLRLWLLAGDFAVLGHAFVSYTFDGGATYEVHAPATGEIFIFP